MVAGRTLAFVVMIPGHGHADLMTISSAGGEPKVICSGWTHIDSLVWRSESQIIVNGSRNGGWRKDQLWAVSYPGCSVHRITNDTNSYSGVSISADSIMTSQQTVNATIWIVDIQGKVRQIGTSPGSEEGREGLAWMKDGSLLYTFKNSDSWALGLMDMNGRRTTQLNLDSHNYIQPSVAPDGETIAFQSDRDGPPSAIFRMGRNSGVAKRLSASFGFRPIVSNDGKWVFFFGRKGTSYGLQRVPFDGGDQQLISENEGYPIGDSSDAQFVATIEPKDNGAFWRVVMTPVNGGRQATTSSWISETSPPIPGLENPPPQLSPNRKEIVYVGMKDGIQNLWAQDFNGKRVQQLSHFIDQQHIFSFAISAEGVIAVSRGTSSSDIVLIKGPRL